MNYGFWLLMGQSTQTGVMTAQLRQMGAVTTELQLQRMAQEHQAVLAQLLFDTEKTAQTLGAVANTDPFAAGVISRLKLDTVDQIHPGLFQTIDSKRSWSAATERLGGMWSAVERHPQWSAMGTGVVGAARELVRWRSAIGADPDATMARLEAIAADARVVETKGKRTRIIMLVIGALLALWAIVGASHWVILLGGLTWSGIMVLLGVTAYSGKRKKAERLEREAAAFRGTLGQFHAFLSSPTGGLLLEQASQQHPALRS